MPSGDGSGPRGEGAKTGRAMGTCAGYSSGGYRSAPGRGGNRRYPGFGSGKGGGGRGWRNRFYQSGESYWRRDGLVPEEEQDRRSEVDRLSSRVEAIADVIEDVSARVKQMLSQRKKGNS